MARITRTRRTRSADINPAWVGIILLSAAIVSPFMGFAAFLLF